MRLFPQTMPQTPCSTDSITVAQPLSFNASGTCKRGNLVNRTQMTGLTLFIGLALILATPRITAAQQGGEIDNGNTAAAEKPFIYFLFGGGGVIGIACTTPVLFMSIVAMALISEHVLTIRQSTLMPPGLAEEVHGLIANGSFSHAEQRCKLRPSFLSTVILAGLQQIRQSYAAIEKSMEDASQSQAARIFRKIEFLAVVGNISTMLGLFGTVVGLVIAFKKVADTQGVARAADLAGGIYLAMMTTVEGLAVAIPCVAAYAVFKHRADQFAADTTLMAEYAFSGYRQSRLTRRPERARPTKTGTEV